MLSRVLSLLLFCSAIGWAQCAPPTYPCARRDTSPIPLPGTLPSWGGLIGAGTHFAEPSFNPPHPPQYVRVTDSNSGKEGVPFDSFGVGTGSGDDSHFNADDSLFSIIDSGTAVYFYGLNTDTMETGLIWYDDPVQTSHGNWSQTRRNFYFGIGLDGRLIRTDFTGCYLGGPVCQPKNETFYNFESDCGINPRIVTNDSGGVGGGDSPIFAALFSPGEQDTATQVVAYVARSQTCYFYNSRFGTVHSYTGKQTPVTGTLSCDGSATVTSAGQFGSGNGWAGVILRIMGLRNMGRSSFQVAAQASASSMTLGAPCAAGSYRFAAEPGTYIGTINNSDRYAVHNAKIDPTGTWMVIELAGGGCYSGKCSLLHAWHIGTTTVKSCLTDCGGHFTTNASGYFNADALNGGTQVTNTMLFRTWANFDTPSESNIVQLSNISSSVNTYPGFDVHQTTKNDPSGSHSYPLIGDTTAPESPAGSITKYASNEVMGWQEGARGPVLRFGHTFDSALSPLGSQFDAAAAIGSVSSTGKFYLFTSDGEGTLGSNTGGKSCSLTGGTCRSDVFLLNLSPDAVVRNKTR